MLCVKNLIKKYGDTVAVDRISFCLADTGICGLVGPNGAGKSTTMNAITGCICIDEGEILIGGHSIIDEAELAKRYLGFAPEIPPLYLEMTVEEYLMFAAELKKVPKQKRKQQIQRCMDQVKVTHFKSRLLRNLSKGYRSRVGLAQALIGDPRLLVLDEPMSGLDPEQVVEMRNLLLELGKKCSILISSHILAEINIICNKIIIVDHGKVVFADDLYDLGKNSDVDYVLRMRIGGKKESIERLLDSCSWIISYDMESISDNDEVDLRVVMNQSQHKQRTKELMSSLVREDMSIISVTQDMLLEEVYMQIVSRNAEQNRR